MYKHICLLFSLAAFGGMAASNASITANPGFTFTYTGPYGTDYSLYDFAVGNSFSLVVNADLMAPPPGYGAYQGGVVFRDAYTDPGDTLGFVDGGTGPDFGVIYVNGEATSNEWGTYIGSFATTYGDVNTTDFYLGFDLYEDISSGDVLTFMPFSYGTSHETGTPWIPDVAGPYTIDLVDQGGNLLSTSAVPEPATYALLAGGVALVFVVVRYRRCRLSSI